MKLKAALTLLLALAIPRSFGADPFEEGVRTTDPLPPGEQQRKFHLPPGFEIQLVAAEPDLRKPMNMSFDSIGRLWLTESREYPFAGPLDKPGRDTIRIFSDFDDTGRARKVQIFADGLNIPIGLYPFRSPNAEGRETWKCIAWSIPNIWVFEDTDGDGKADKREKLFGPFDHTRDTHGNQASFRRGFDGWLYATHGFNNDSHVQGRDGHRIDLNSGNTYRMRLDGSRLEHHTWGQVNPFGLAWDPSGNLYSSDCHSAPVYQLLAGGYYPSFGKPHDGLGFAPVLMEHAHGSTAIDGIVYYADDLWPDEFKDNIFIGNVMTSRLNRDRLTFIGSTPKANELPDFLTCDDPWFRPVDNRFGPDGALYIADFYNRIIGHYEVPLLHPGRDRERGRIWRVVYRGDEGRPRLRPAALADSLEGLIGETSSPSLERRILAMNTVEERFGDSARDAVQKVVSRPTNGFQQIHALWLANRLGILGLPELTGAARSTDVLVRVHAQRINGHRLGLAGTPESESAPPGLAVALNGLTDPDALVQRCAAEALGQFPSSASLRPLLELLRRVPAGDTHLAYVVRKSLRNILRDDALFSKVVGDGAWSDADLSALANVAVAVNSAPAGTFLLRQLERSNVDRDTAAAWMRHAARHAPETDLDKLAVMARARFAGDLDLQTALFKSIEDGLAQRGATWPPAARAWGADLAAQLLNSTDPVAIGWNNSMVEGVSDPTNPWFLQQRASGDGDQKSWFICSLPPGGEALTGILSSKAFAVPASFSFFLAGHDGYPEKPAQKKNVVRLRTTGTGEVLAEAYPPRDDTAQRVTWDLKSHQGKQAWLEITDADTGDAYAWLAVGRFDPQVISLPPVGPRQIAERQQAGAEMARTLALTTLTSQLKGLSQAGDAGMDARAAAVNALVAVVPRPEWRGFAAFISDKQVPLEWRKRLADEALLGDGGDSTLALWTALPAAPLRVQTKLASAAIQSDSDKEQLLQMVESGKVPARLLIDRDLKQKLLAGTSPEFNARIEKLTKGVSPVSAEAQKLIDQRRSAYAPATARAGDGAKVFTQNCAVCHRVDGQGGLVGPQLDGIGNRGLERLCEDILDPNRNLDHAFRTHTFTLKDGDIVSGLPRREEGELIIIADSTGKEIPIPKQNVRERHESDVSLMPENFGEIIAPADFNNLLAFLLSKGPARSATP